MFRPRLDKVDGGSNDLAVNRRSTVAVPVLLEGPKRLNLPRYGRFERLLLDYDLHALAAVDLIQCFTSEAGA